MLFRPFQFNSYVTQNPELPLDRMMDIGTMMQGRYDRSQAAIRETKNYLDMIQVAPGDYELKQQMSQQIEEDIDNMMSEYDGRLETASFQQDLSKTITRIATDPRIAGMQETRKNYDNWQATVHAYKAEGKKYWDRNPYYDDDGNPISTIDSDGKVKPFIPQVEPILEWSDKARDLMADLEEQIEEIRFTEFDDFIRYGKVSQITNEDVRKRLSSALNLFVESDEGRQLIDYMEDQYRQANTLTIDGKTYPSYREAAKAYARALLTSAGEMRTYTRTHATYLNRPKGKLNRGSSTDGVSPEPPAPATMSTVGSTKTLISNVSSPEVVENRQFEFDQSVNQAKAQLSQASGGQVAVDDIQIIDNNDGTFTINYPSNFEMGSLSDFETTEIEVRSMLKRNKVLAQNAKNIERSSMQQVGIDPAQYPSIYKYEDNLVQTLNNERLTKGIQNNIRNVYVEKALAAAANIEGPIAEAYDQPFIYELSQEVQRYIDGEGTLQEIEEVKANIEQVISQLPFQERSQMEELFKENIDKLDVILNNFTENPVRAGNSIFAPIRVIKDGNTLLSLPTKYRQKLKELRETGVINQEEYNESLNDMHELFKDEDLLEGDVVTIQQEDGTQKAMTRVNAFFEEMDSLDEPRLRPYKVVGPGFVDDDAWETSKERADEMALSILRFDANGAIGFDVTTGKPIKKEDISNDVMTMYKNGDYGNVKAKFDFQGFGEAPEDWFEEDENTRLKGRGIVVSYPSSEGKMGYMFIPESNAQVKELFKGSNDLELAYLATSSEIDDKMNDNDGNVAILSPAGSNVEYVIERLTHPTNINGHIYNTDEYKVSYQDENGRQVVKGFADKYNMIQEYWGLHLAEQQQKGLAFNVGNIRNNEGEFKTFSTLQGGISALLSDINVKFNRVRGSEARKNYGKGSKYNPATGQIESDQDLILGEEEDNTLLDFFEVYANYDDDNDSMAYAQFVLDQLSYSNPALQGKKPWEVKLKDLNTRAFKKQMALAMVQKEKGADFEYLNEVVKILNNAY